MTVKELTAELQALQLEMGRLERRMEQIELALKVEKEVE